jgi:hypothetical protein
MQLLHQLVSPRRRSLQLLSTRPVLVPGHGSARRSVDSDTKGAVHQNTCVLTQVDSCHLDSFADVAYALHFQSMPVS